MGKLVIADYAQGAPILTKPRCGKRKPQFIPTKVMIRMDPSDQRYAVVNGKLRRKPETLPIQRRWSMEQQLAA